MKTTPFLLAALLMAVGHVHAQKKNFDYKFYGFVRGDLFYNTRANQAPVDGNFYLFPLDKRLDADGKDLNAGPNGSFYTFTTRLGLDVKGPDLGKAKTAAKIEVDFGGFSVSTTMLRIRQAYVSLGWERHKLLIGQTWHPLFGDVVPDLLNLSTGAPFQPFNREPQLNYTFSTRRFSLSAAALWQLQYTSSGPNGASEEYLKNSCVPELYGGVNFRPADGLLIGAGVHFISLKPRKESVWKGKTYKVNERVSTASYELHARYVTPRFTVAAKTLLASMLDHTALLGGYGVSRVNEDNGACTYTPFRHSTSWLNLTFGRTWKAHLFAGYTKNLGTASPLLSEEDTYGVGLNIDRLVTASAAVSYNRGNWQIGIEYMPATAYYGSINVATGKVNNTHPVTNHRILALLMFHF